MKCFMYRLTGVCTEKYVSSTDKQECVQEKCLEYIQVKRIVDR